MPKIVIKEIDETSPGVIDEVTDVVYIPGFVNIDPDINSNLYNEDCDKYFGIKVNEPTLISSLNEFTSLCGNEPAYFEGVQLYSSLGSYNADGSYTGFSEEAVPYSDTMFTDRQADPSWVMAKEIISAGLPVLYERVNQDNYTKDIIATEDNKPTDWAQNYSKYKTSSEGYTSVIATSAPLFFTKQNGNKYDASLTYYERVGYEDNGQPVPAFISVNQEDIVTVKTTIINEEGHTKEVEIIANEGYVDSENNKTAKAYYTKDELTEEYYIKTQIKFNNVQEENPEFNAETTYTITGSTAITEEPEDWASFRDEEHKYFSRTSAQEGSNQIYTYTQISAGTPFDAENTYTLNNVSQVIEKPADWVGSSVYYTKTGDTVYTYTGLYPTLNVTYSPTFTEAQQTYGTIIVENGNGEYIEVTQSPEDWGMSSYFGIGKESIIPKEYTPQSNIPNVTGYYIPHNWITGYSQGVVSAKIWSDVISPQWVTGQEYRLTSRGINIQTMYNALQSIYAITDNGLADKGNYSIKYLTSGGYPVYEYDSNSIVTQMMNLADERGDCVAFIDHTDNEDRNQNIDQRGSLYNTVENDVIWNTHGEFATMFTPWAAYNRTTTDLRNNQVPKVYKAAVRMPASFAYFLGLADSITVNPNWLAIAGVARGLVQNLSSGGMTTIIPNGAADKMEPRDGIAINPITNIRPYGYTIWGNRTLKNNATEGNLTATSFLNIRNLVSDIKKRVYRTARKLTFEQNNDVLWVNFKAEMTPLLDQMLHGYGISSYSMAQDTTHPRYNERATLCVRITISPIEPVEDFYVTVVMTDDEATVSE